MARPSKLTPTQWDEIGKRIAAGESKTTLAKEFGVSVSVVFGRFQEFPKKEVLKVGQALAALPPSGQAAAVSLADDLRSIGSNLAAAARYGSATAHRLHALAHGEVQKIDDAAPMDSVEALKGVAALTRTANEAASMGMGMLAANKDHGKDSGGPVPLELVGSDIHG